MSLLEDVFLEDEAGEAQELERVIEGDEYDERPLSPNSDDNEERDDEAEEEKRRVDPTQAKAKRVVKNPRFLLNPARLTGPRGIHIIPDHFKDFKFKGKGHEKEDLDVVLKKLEHWAYRLYPKFGFHDCLKKIEMLGKKRPVMVHLQKIRSDQFQPEEAVVQRDSSDDELPPPEDEFDKLLQHQIDLARATPAPPSGKKLSFHTPSGDRSLIMPKATSSPSISDEQRERMLRNRRLAEERKLAKLRNENPSAEPPKENNVEVTTPNVIPKEVDEVVVRKHNRSNVIDSSDDEEPAVNRSIAVDVHNIVDDEMKDDGIDKNVTPKRKSLEITSELEVVKKPVAQRHNRINAIDSSDEDEPVANQAISVDVHDKAENEKINVELNDTFNNDTTLEQASFNVNADVIDEVPGKNDISNVNERIDDEVPVSNETVNAHDKVNEINDVETCDRNQDTMISNNNNVDAENDIDSVIHKESDKLDINTLTNSTISNSKDQHAPSTSSDVNEVGSDVELKNKNSLLNDESDSTKNVDTIEEVMDVDFSDDF